MRALDRSIDWYLGILSGARRKEQADKMRQNNKTTASSRDARVVILALLRVRGCHTFWLPPLSFLQAKQIFSYLPFSLSLFLQLDTMCECLRTLYRWEQKRKIERQRKKERTTMDAHLAPSSVATTGTAGMTLSLTLAASVCVCVCDFRTCS